MTAQDEQFFKQHPDRRARIRKPEFTPHRDSQRAVRYLDEGEMQFRQLSPHQKERRRIIAYRTPADHPSHPNHIMPIPFLLNADETVVDEDRILLPIIHELMLNAAKANSR
jgi:hypothetical protein